MVGQTLPASLGATGSSQLPNAGTLPANLEGEKKSVKTARLRPLRVQS